MMKLSLAIETPEVPKRIPVALLAGSFEEKLSKAAAWGADGVELMTVSPELLDGKKMRAQLENHHLVCSAVASGGIGFLTGRTLLHADAQFAEEAFQKLQALIAFAAVIGSPLVTIGSFRGRLASIQGDGIEKLKEILQQGARIAEEKGVRLVLEPLNRHETDFLHTAEEVLTFIDQVGEPALGLLLDTYHMNIEEKSWETPFVRGLGSGKLWHVHLGDNNRLSPGEGMIPFEHVVGVLHRAGYAGFLSAELLAKPDPDTAGRRTLDAMRSIMEKL